jgi:HAE1 family hydrophobic/amphiphilic exporter-1
VQDVVTIAGISALDNSASLANAGIAYLVLKPWSDRESLLELYPRMATAFDVVESARVLVVPPPPIQGIGNAGGFAMQVQLRDGSNDFVKLQNAVTTLVGNAQSQSGLQRVSTTFSATTPQFRVDVDRIKAETMHVTVDQVFAALSSYMGSSYVTQFNKFGRTFQIYVQSDSRFRLSIDDINKLNVRNANGEMIPLATLVTITPETGPSLINLYNLYPAAGVIGLPARGFSSGQAMRLMEQVAERSLPPGTGYEWTGMSYQEKIVGGQLYIAFGLGLLLVYLVLAGQYESWLAPLSIVLSVPLALVGPVLVLNAVGIDNNLYVQIGLILLIALSAKNAILIVEVARDLRKAGQAIGEAAVNAARARFRPILMTSFAFILGVVPLVMAAGAGASARKSIGVTVFSGMLASTCLAVLFVPALFVVLQRFEEWLRGRKGSVQKSHPQPKGAG